MWPYGGTKEFTLSSNTKLWQAEYCKIGEWVDFSTLYLEMLVAAKSGYEF